MPKTGANGGQLQPLSFLEGRHKGEEAVAYFRAGGAEEAVEREEQEL
jgi:hypothetical protein